MKKGYLFTYEGRKYRVRTNFMGIIHAAEVNPNTLRATMGATTKRFNLNELIPAILEVTEVKGDITFYKDQSGKLFQKLGVMDTLVPVVDGKMKYMHITNRFWYELRYNLNGVHGFAICKGRKILEDNIWEIGTAHTMLDSFGTMEVWR